MIAANLLALTLLIGFAGGRWLPAAAWVRRAPRLAIAAWCVLLGTVGAGILAVGVTVLLPAPPVVCALLVWCIHPDSPGAALALRVAGDTVALGVAGTLLTALVRAGWVLRAQVRSRRRHRAMLTLAGRPDAGFGGTVIEHPWAAAYVAPDRRVVVTSGALERLTPAQLGAVLAHEHAHAGGRHQVLLDAVRLAARALPGLRLTRVAQEQVGRLVELRADDVAARTHGRRALAAALVTMAVGGVTPHGLVAAHGGDVAERLRRLLVPPKRLGPWRAAAIGAALLVVTVLPVVGLALDGWWPGVVRCVWIG
ncbi:MAG TPA: M56 family metallopeptidase [Asanoa sp.]|nr:M56 family metallopeptidase [Asanoa sp.]